MAPIILITLAVIVVAGLGYWSWKREQARQLAWGQWASERGWSYTHDRDHELAEYFEFVERFGHGRNHYAEDTLRGNLNGRPAVAFSYHYETRSQNADGEMTTEDHWMWMTALQMERPFPELLISPESFGKRLLHTFSGSDIDFESIEFSRAYEVKCNDRKFAYDFCNQQMIEYLLQSRDSVLELEGHWLVTYGPGRLALEQVDPTFRWLNHVRSLMPGFLFRPDHPH